MSRKRVYKLAFEEEPPKAERQGAEPKEEYAGTINAFVSSGKDYARVEIPEGEKLLAVIAGLRNAIRRLGKSNEVKTIIRRKKLYLITKAYSDEKGWTWKIERKK